MQNRPDVQPYRHHSLEPKKDEITNNAIAIAAILCFGFLLILITVTLIFSRYFSDPSNPELSEGQDKIQNLAEPVQTSFDEGYSMVLPDGFGQKTRRVADEDEVIYNFIGPDACKLTFVIIKDENEGSLYLPKLPKTYQEAVIERIPELKHTVEGDIQPNSFSVDGMPGVLFKFFEKETFRGVDFTYYMIAYDRDTKLAMKISGKHGKISERASSIDMPDHWEDAMMTLKHDRGRR